jgi:hypothetical protein
MKTNQTENLIQNVIAGTLAVATVATLISIACALYTSLQISLYTSGSL